MVGLLLIIASFASFFQGSFAFSHERRIAAHELDGSLAKARLNSMTGKGGASWGVAVVDNTIILFRGNSYASRDAAYDETYALFGTVAIPDWSEAVFDRVTGTTTAQPNVTFSDNWGTDMYSLNTEGVLSPQ